MSDDDDKPSIQDTQPLGKVDISALPVREINLDNDERVETGPIKFIHEGGYEDWPGIFLRGDTAMGYVMYLRGLIESLEDRLDLQDSDNSGIWFYIMMTEGLIDLLQECYESGPYPNVAQETDDEE